MDIRVSIVRFDFVAHSFNRFQYIEIYVEYHEIAKKRILQHCFSHWVLYRDVETV